MIKFIGELPRKCTVAFSGGVDSVAVTDFLIRGKREVTLAFFHHGTRTSDEAENFVKSFSESRNIALKIGKLERLRRKGLSEEEHWRNERYEFLDSIQGPVITCHHLDDAIETWIFTSLHGQGRLIPYSRGNVIRPFLVTPKEEFKGWCTRRNLTWIEDASNCDLRYVRNRIRHRIMPEVLHVNPGIRTTIRKKYTKFDVESTGEESKNHLEQGH